MSRQHIVVADTPMRSDTIMPIDYQASTGHFYNRDTIPALWDYLRVAKPSLRHATRHNDDRMKFYRVRERPAQPRKSVNYAELRANNHAVGNVK